MSSCCFLCNSQSSISLRNATNLFGEHNTLKSGKKLHEVVSEILEKDLKENAVHSQIVCKKCYKSCSEYDFTQVSLQSMKADLINQFKTSIQSHNINYATYETDVTKTKTNTPVAATPKIGRIVLPASKLRPLTSVELLKVGNRSHLLTDKFKAGLPKVTINSLPSPAVRQPEAPEKPDVLATLTKFLQKPETTDEDDLKKYLITKDGTKEIFSKSETSAELADAHVDETNDADEDAMEIDEDFAVSVVPSSNGKLVFEVQGFKNIPSQPAEQEYLNVDILQSLDPSNEECDRNNIIVGKVEILDSGNEEEEAQTIVLNGDNSSILRMMSGQKFMYDGNEISLMLPEGDARDERDGQDSNEESQIELQVSGDEETANAIIAAAREQGGAFIKVESGEMYRVQSVRGAADGLADTIAHRDGLFVCLLCRNSDKPENEKMESTSDPNAAMSHMRRAHDARVYICSLCAAMFRRRIDYTTHFGDCPRPLRDRRVGTAPLRDRRVEVAPSETAEHSLKPRARAAGGSHRCARCGKTFASKYTLQAHLKIHSDRPRPFSCSQCEKSFFTQQNLNQHEKTHSSVKDFVCGVCNKSFGTQHNLEVHGIVHSREKPYVCGVCEKAFARRAEVRDHMRTHTGERPFSCDTCGAAFSQRSNLDSHRRATHLNERRHHCAHCPKRFKRRRLLEYHIKASHTGERPLKCDTCGASFVYPEHYKKHVRIHTGERPYVCEICGKTFTTRDNRNTHRFTHSDKKPYECLSCGAGFMRKQLLYAHMSASGHLAESIVVNQPRVTKVHTSNVATQILDVQTFETKKYETLFENEELSLDASGKQPETAPAAELLDAQDMQQTQIVANDENGDVVRLIQVQLPGGAGGWVAVND
ncbi:zinc finger and SCAN domain-containing protein 2-like isoform X3 [Bombyx mandarina]|nr:zinc finger and SCAN domain-containing protein 2-like isoform X3 [Bombyx mandarina]